MSAFTKFEAFRPLRPGSEIYELTEDLTWEIGKKGSDWQLLIVKGTRFDITSPSIMRWILSPHDRMVLPAAAIHDELLNRGFDEAFASSEFRRSVEARGAKEGRTWALFVGTLIWTRVRRYFKTG